MSYLDRLRRRPAGTVGQSEIERVIQLPSYSPPNFDQTTLQHLSTSPLHLNVLQREALATLRDLRCLFGPIGVGHGKSWIAILAGTVLNCDISVILAPASTLDTLRRTHELLRQHFRTPRLHIMSYAQLSRPSDTCILTKLTAPYPDNKVLIVADEAHKLKALSSARTLRVIRYLKSHPDATFIPLSGTMTSKGIKDFAHLAEMSLRDKSPLPRNPHDLESWSQCLDVDGRPTQGDWSCYQPLMSWSPILKQTTSRTERARAVFQRRLMTAPGVVASEEGSLGVSLVISDIQGLDIPNDVKTLMERADEGDDPDGNPLIDDVSVWRCKQSLAQGFYYRWDWPHDTPDHAWMDTRAAWHRHVRAEIKHSADQGYDSPLLIANRVHKEAQAGQRFSIHRAWIAWCAHKHKPAPPVKTVWVDDYLVRHAAQWACAQSEPVILWYSSRAIGDLFKSWGWRVYGAGEEPGQQAHTCCMSIQAHGIGKNLQAWSRALITAPPSGGQTWEQLLGRLHRQGQRADDVQIHVYRHAEPFRDSLTKALTEAQYIEQTSGNAQKLNYAVKTWTPC